MNRLGVMARESGASICGRPRPARGGAAITVSWAAPQSKPRGYWIARFRAYEEIEDLIMRRLRSSRGRLEGWPRARSRLWPSFETRASLAKRSGKVKTKFLRSTEPRETFHPQWPAGRGQLRTRLRLFHMLLRRRWHSS